MQISDESIQTVLSKTDSALVVDVLEVEKIEIETFHRAITFKVNPVETLWGHAHPQGVRCTYDEGVPHVRGAASISPLVTGSGIEFELKKGSKVIFLLAADGKLLRAIHLFSDDAEAVLNYQRSITSSPSAAPQGSL